MNFLLFFIFFSISLLVYFFIGFLCYELFLKKLILSKIDEFNILKSFDTDSNKSILDINTDDFVDSIHIIDEDSVPDSIPDSIHDSVPESIPESIPDSFPPRFF